MYIWGKVIHGKKRGRLLGFPTANLVLHKHIDEGIYISSTRIGKVIQPSATFIGPARTFEETSFQVETYILQFSQLIYGKWISVRLIKKIRENQTFTNNTDLIQQMHHDISKVKAYFNDHE